MDARGAGLVEYLVLLGLVALAAFGGYRAFGRAGADTARAQAQCVATLSNCEGSQQGEAPALPTRRERIDAQAAAAAGGPGPAPPAADPAPAANAPPAAGAAPEPDGPEPPAKRDRSRSTSAGPTAATCSGSSRAG